MMKIKMYNNVFKKAKKKNNGITINVKPLKKKINKEKLL